MILHTIIILLATLLILGPGIYGYPNQKADLREKLPQKLRFLLPGKNLKSRLICSAIYIVTGEGLLFADLTYLVKNRMFTDGNHIPAAILIFAGAIPFLALLLMHFKPDKTHLLSLCRGRAICAIVLLLLEVLVFNARSFTPTPTCYTIPSDDIVAEEGDHLMQAGNAYIVTGDTRLELFNLPENTHGLLVSMEREKAYGTKLMRVWLEMKDDNFKNIYQTVANKYTIGYGNDCAFSFEPYGSPHSLLLHFALVENPVTITEIRAVSALPFHFSAVRYLGLFLLIFLYVSIMEFRLYRVTYDRRSSSHRLAVCCVALLSIYSTFLFWKPGELMQPYTHEDYPNSVDPYYLTFDAFHKGQTWLDIEVDPRLEELENVYDSSERSESDYNARWDLTYFNGKYYSYFGITPVLTLYYPVYILTGRLPTIPMTIDIFATAAAGFLCLTILAAVRLMVRKPNLLLLLASLPTAVCCSGIYYCLQYTDKYYVAVSSGMCFLLLTLWLGLTACSLKNMRTKCILFALGGLSLACCAGARPTMAVSAAVLLPFFLGILLRKREKLQQRLLQAGSFAVPLLAGVSGLLVYNALRFGSPLDFGASYQLTVSDVHANTLRADLFPAAMYHYFLQFPASRNAFPYLEAEFNHLLNYGRYIYTEPCTGALTYPCILLAVLLLPPALQRKGAELISGVTTSEKRIFLLLCVTVPVILAWMDFCMGGINQRYVTDIMPLLTIGAVIILLRTTRHSAYRYGITHGAFVLTFCMTWLLMVGIREGALLQRCPNLYDTARNILMFWQ